MLLHFGSLEGVPQLRHALTTRPETRSTAEVAAGLGLGSVATLRQVHGARVVDLGSVPAEPPAADALVLTEPGLAGAVFAADCPLLLLVAPKERVLALVHSGWRSTAAGVLEATVRHLETRHDVSAQTLQVAIGPCIGAARYEVSDDVVAAVQATVPHADGLAEPTRPGHARLDLGLVLERQLDALGVPAAHVERCGACTWEAKDTFHSYRRDGKAAGRHVLIAGWR